MEGSIRNLSIIYGVAGAILICSLNLYMWNERVIQGGLFTTGLFLTPLLLAIGAQVHSKFKLNQFINIRQAMLAYVICILIIFISESVIIYLIYNIWDPSMQEVVYEAQLERRAELVAQGQQVPEPIRTDYSIKNTILSTAMKFLVYLIPGFIIALVIKKKPTTA